MNQFSTIPHSLKGTFYSTISLLGLVISFQDDLIRDQVAIAQAANAGLAAMQQAMSHFVSHQGDPGFEFFRALLGSFLLFAALSPLLSAAIFWRVACLAMAVVAFAFHIYHGVGHGMVGEVTSGMMVGITCVLPAALAISERWFWIQES